MIKRFPKSLIGKLEGAAKLRSINPNWTIRRGQKKGYEFSFSWFFAIIVGVVIIFLAVYITTKIVQTQRMGEEAKRGRQLATLLTPFETNLENGEFATIFIPSETKLFNNCSVDSTFGSQYFSTLIKSGIGGAWRSPNDSVKSSFHNKYLFSSPEVYGSQRLYVLSKPFKFPFKIADLMIMWSDKEEYCFISPWPDVKTEIVNLKAENIHIDSGCSSTAKNVCFGSSSSDCDITVSSNDKTVTHSGSRPVHYVESLDDNDKYALLYAAIFSDPSIYECQIKRLMARASQLSELYELKSNYITQKGCRSAPVLPDALNDYQTKITAPGFTSASLSGVIPDAQSLKEKNAPLGCKLF
jgi:hypothetical protein